MKKIYKGAHIFVVILIFINIIEGIREVNQGSGDKYISNYFNEQAVEAEAGKVKIISCSSPSDGEENSESY